MKYQTPWDKVLLIFKKGEITSEDKSTLKNIFSELGCPEIGNQNIKDKLQLASLLNAKGKLHNSPIAKEVNNICIDDIKQNKFHGDPSLYKEDKHNYVLNCINTIISNMKQNGISNPAELGNTLILIGSLPFEISTKISTKLPDLNDTLEIGLKDANIPKDAQKKILEGTLVIMERGFLPKNALLDKVTDLTLSLKDDANVFSRALYALESLKISSNTDKMAERIINATPSKLLNDKPVLLFRLSSLIEKRNAIKLTPEFMKTIISFNNKEQMYLQLFTKIGMRCLNSNPSEAIKQKLNETLRQRNFGQPAKVNGSHAASEMQRRRHTNQHRGKGF